MNTLPLRFSLCLTTAAAVSLASPVKAAPSAAREWNEQLLNAIRLNVPNPPAHARNLFQTAVAMYNAWAAYDATAVGYLYNEKVSPLPADVETARREAVSYAAYRILKERFKTPPPGLDPAKIAAVNASLDAKLAAMGYDKVVALAATTTDPTPAELGKRIGQAILNWGAADGSATRPILKLTTSPSILTWHPRWRSVCSATTATSNRTCRSALAFLN
jgi:hypothetical protein